MNMQRKTTGDGLTGFWMQQERSGNVRVVNGTMYKLLSAKSAGILTRILSPRFVLRSLRQRLYVSRKNRRADNRKSSYPRTYGLIGLQTRYVRQGLGNSTTLRQYKARRAQVDMSPNTCSNQPFSQLIGLRDGSAYATLKDFHDRRTKRAKR